MVKKSVTLTKQQNEWVQAQLSDGKYASDSEVLRDLIRKEQARQNDIQEIRQALISAENSGSSNRNPSEIMTEILVSKGIDSVL